MNAEILIRSEAEKFCRKLKNLDMPFDGATEFKKALTGALSDYYENLDKLIFIYEVHRQIDERYDRHLLNCKFPNEPEKCPTSLNYVKSKFFIEQELRYLNPSTEYSFLRPNVNSDLLKQNLAKLVKHPAAGKAFQSAIDKLNEARFERNLLDDLRLSLELLLKSVLKNDKSLENQTSLLGSHFKATGTSKEVNNMFVSLVGYFAKYQNSYIKHNDKVNQKEVEFLVNLTASFISFLLAK